jgi:ankyrin repeat protein
VAARFDREPVLYACFSRFLRSDPRRADGVVRIVRLLLDHGADANAHYTTTENGETWIQTALYGAAGIANNRELTRMLLDAGADVNELQGDPGSELRSSSLGTEALYHASEFSDVTCLRLLLEASPPPHPGRISYCLARMLDFENPAGVDLYLDHGADPNLRIPWLRNRTHLHRAVAYGRSAAIVRRLLEAGADPNVADDRGLTPLRSAVRHGREDVAGVLRAAGADVTKLTPDDVAPATIDPDVLCDAAGRNDVVLMRRLLDTGADPNAIGGSDEMPPLHSACWRGRGDAVRLLIERGADVHAVNRFGGDALDTTAHGSVNCHAALGGITTKLAEEITHGDYPAIADMLIGAGASLPDRLGGSEGVQDVLRRAGVPDPE